MEVNDLELREQIGRNIRQSRIALGIAQKHLAEKLNINPTTMNNYEQGHVDIPISRMIMLADTLQTTLDALTGHTPHVVDARTLDSKKHYNPFLYQKKSYEKHLMGMLGIKEPISVIILYAAVDGHMDVYYTDDQMMIKLMSTMKMSPAKTLVREVNPGKSSSEESTDWPFGWSATNQEGKSP